MTAATLIPQASIVKGTCGWQFIPTRGKSGLGDALVLGPQLRKSQISLDRKLVEQWVKGAPGRSSTLSRKLVRQLPKVLVVLEEWVAPAWTHVSTSTDPSEPDYRPFAVGLNTAPFPEWKFLALGGDTQAAPSHLGSAVR